MGDTHHRFRDDPRNGESVGGDSPELSAYAEAMARGEPFIEMTLSVDQPIELGDFVSAFTALGTEFERFARGEGSDSHATLYVGEVRPGSIIAILHPYLGTIGFAADQLQRAFALEEFVRRYGAFLGLYQRPGGRLADATTARLNSFLDQVSAITHVPNSGIQLAAIEMIDGKREVRAAFKFDTKQAREIAENVEIHKHEIENASGENRERVLMVFTRTDVRTTAVGKRSGEQVRIEAISSRSVPIIYASDMAELAIKREITEADDNVYKKGFVVDVNLELRSGRLIAYRIANLHQVIDLPDDDDEP